MYIWNHPSMEEKWGFQLVTSGCAVYKMFSIFFIFIPHHLYKRLRHSTRWSF